MIQVIVTQLVCKYMYLSYYVHTKHLLLSNLSKFKYFLRNWCQCPQWLAILSWYGHTWKMQFTTSMHNCIFFFIFIYKINEDIETLRNLHTSSVVLHYLWHTKQLYSPLWYWPFCLMSCCCSHLPSHKDQKFPSSGEVNLQLFPW